MGWRGAVRSFAAAARAAEREAKRRQRELERQQKQYEKMQELEQAAYEVQTYENYVDRLVSIHKEVRARVPWREIAATDPPTEPSRSQVNEEQARQKWMNYQPSLWDKLFGRTESKRERLFQRIEEAKQADDADYRQALEQYKRGYADWKESRAVAERLLAGDAKAYMEVIRELDPFSELTELGSNISFDVGDRRIVNADVHIRGEEIIPKEAKSLLKSGKLSTKTMPKGQFYELYQDHVCSCVLRVANELLAVLPIDAVVVTALDTLLNTQTGHLEEQPILSVAIPRRTLETLRLESIDPSDSMQNFVHRMALKKTKGFSAVERVNASGLEPPE